MRHQSYFDYIKTIPNVIGAWDLGEKHGAIAYDRRRGNNGAHVGVTLGQPGIGDGRPSPLYDGINDYTNIFSAAFQAAFNGTEGTAAIWFKMDGAGVWIDGAVRRALLLFVDNLNSVSIYKDGNNNRFVLQYEANNILKIVSVTPYSPISWVMAVLTWSASRDEIKGYLDAVQQGIIERFGSVGW